MKERQKQILRAAVKEYQRTGQPVASGVLTRKFRFHFSPATVRSEMLTLDKDGFLEQPYTSAGRVPTDKALRFFIDETEKGQEDWAGNEQEEVWRRLEAFHEESMKEMARFLAECTGYSGFSGFSGRMADFHGVGLKWLTEEPEFKSGEFNDILKKFDSLEEDFNRFFGDLDERVEIFIGRENPIKYLRRCSLLITGFEDEEGKRILGILGPKRMNYQKNKFVLEEARKRIGKQNN